MHCHPWAALLKGELSGAAPPKIQSQEESEREAIANETERKGPNMDQNITEAHSDVTN